MKNLIVLEKIEPLAAKKFCARATRKQFRPQTNSGYRGGADKIYLQDLRDGLRLGTPMEELADFLMRNVEEVRAKAAELQFQAGLVGGGQ